MVGTHDKSQPKIWKQVTGEEEVVNIDARNPQTVSPAAASDSSLFSHPNIGENLVSERYVVYWLHKQGKQIYGPNQHI